ncbi:MAG: hypothetical protein AAFU79_27990 [Myxococcota bacterium]
MNKTDLVDEDMLSMVEAYVEQGGVPAAGFGHDDGEVAADRPQTGKLPRVVSSGVRVIDEGGRVHVEVAVDLLEVG